jgi:hypothetical protein
MTGAHAPFPPPEEGLQLHLRLCAHDAVAPADLCGAYLVPLGDWVGTEFPTVDPHLRQTAVDEALMSYLKQPQAYDPRRLPLAAYLRMTVRSDLGNLRRREGRHHRRRVAWSVVELGEQRGYLSGREEEPARRLERAEEAAAWAALLRSVAAGLTPAERRVLDLMLAGERRTPAFAGALGLADLPAGDQERAVKRAKDRITKRLQRERVKHG